MTEDYPTPQVPDESSWFAQLSDSAIPSNGASATAGLPLATGARLAPVHRVRPVRPPIVPKAVWFVTGGIVVALALLVAAIAMTFALTQIAVPNVVGEPLGNARTQLGSVGLEVTISERRFSSLPRNQVIEQTPAAGSQAHKGDRVALVVSAGTEEFAMPDVVNQQLRVAQGSLESRGLVVIVDQVVSSIASGTVLMSTPIAGTQVRTGDTVRLQVASQSSSSAEVQPYDLSGQRFVIDAAPISGNGLDPSLEVARRLRALLEASGAGVVMLRSSTSTATTDADRARAASLATATAAVGFSVLVTGDAGRVVYGPAMGSVGGVPAASTLASGIANALAVSAPPASIATTATDLVLQSSLAPWTRVSLGSLSARVDRNSYADPQWSDSVARAVYAALGKQFGTPAQL